MLAQKTASPTQRSVVAVQGSTFGEICGMTDKFEGCVVREMRRLDELMKNLHLAAKVIRAANRLTSVTVCPCQRGCMVHARMNKH
jgi:superfamily II RNA helicase